MLPPADPKRIAWQRYWAKHDGKIHVDAAGYLVAPTRDRKFDLQPEVFAYDEIAARPFLVLMGETGSGKTDAILEIGRKLETDGEAVCYVDLGLVDTSAALKRELEDAKRLADRGARVTVLFDQYEVCSLREAYRFVAREMADFPQRAVKVRLGCRSGSWTSEAAREFLARWPDLMAVEVGPLTRDNVLLGLSSVSSDAVGLLGRLEDRDLAPLLNRPVTLRMIMRMIEGGEDPSSMTMAEVYRKGIDQVVRPAPEKPHKLEGGERLAIARRIAAASVFCHRHTISELPDDDAAGMIHVSQLARGNEATSDEDNVRVSETAVLEVLRDSGLLNSRGTGRHGWIHASYAEYLAADYVRACRMPAEQVRGLLRLTDDGSPIIPDLQGVVSWLLINGALPFGDEFISKWPTTVLRSDVQSLTVAQRERLVDALLRDAERGVLDTRSAIVRLRLGKLAHPGIEAQLRAYLADRDKSLRARGLAMQIAASCEMDTLAMPIARIALDNNEPIYVRETAARIVALMSDESAHKALRPFIDPGDDADADDQLRGAAFQALWPKHMSSQELFRLLSEPRNNRFIGSYAVFLYGLPKGLGPDDLEPALAWASAQRSRDDLGRVSRLVDEILFRGFANLDRPGVLDRVADILISRASAHAHLFESDKDRPAPLDIASRRLLVAHLAKRIAPDDLSRAVLWARPSLLDPDDVEWLIFQHRADDAGPWPRLLSDLILIRGEAMRDHLGDLRDAADASPSLGQALRWCLGPIDIDSEEAKQARRHHEQTQRWAARDAEDLEEAKRRTIVEAVLAGDIERFVQISYALSDKHHDLGLDLAALPGWQRLAPAQHDRIRAVAQEYLLTRDEDRARWLGKSSYPYVALAGYQALRLLRHEAGRLEKLPVEVWPKWVGIAIGMPFEHENERDAQRDFVRYAGRFAKDALNDALRALVASDEMGDHHHLLSLFPAPWDAALVGLIVDAAKSASEKGRIFLIEAIFAGSPERGEALSWELIAAPATTKETRNQLYALLARTGGSDTRARVRRAIFSSPNETGRQVIPLLAAAMELRSPDLSQRMSDAELADLYAWVEKEFPAAADNEQDALRGVGMLRNDLLTNLGRRSTADTVAALQSLVEVFPQHTYLQRMHHEAKERLATETWNPPTVADLLKLAKDRNKRFIESAEDLQTAIVESLKRLDIELSKTETPMAEFLWNDCPNCKPRFVSKDETALSNLVKRHLELDLVGRGVVINREVEVRRSGTGMGKRTDIHVRAGRPGVPLEDARALTVVIETKKCSNPTLMTAMKVQLVDEYLKPLGLRHGIYLVGRFDTPANRCCSADKTLDSIRSELEEQAKAETPDHRVTAVVLDTALPSSMIPKATPTSALSD